MWALLALALAPIHPARIDELTQRSLAFEQHWNLYIRHLCGCPDEGETTKETCTRQRFVDYGEFMKAAKAAEKLFPKEKQK